MSTRNRWILPGLAAGALLAMLAVPATRDLLRTQLGNVGRLTGNPFVTGSKPSSGDTRRFDAYVAAYPRDAEVQIAAAAMGESGALEGSTSPEELATRQKEFETRALDLARRFPDSPAAQSAALRILTRWGLAVEAGSVRTALGLPPESGRQPTETRAPARETVEAALVIEKRGETLAPDNALFPFLAAGQFAMEGRRLEARAAFLRAGHCTYYDDFVSVEAEGRKRISSGAFGPGGVFGEMAVSMGVLFPHLASARQTARVALAEAEALERSGDRRAAADIRLAVMRVGSLMRRQASSAIGNLVGIAITSIMATRYPGEPSMPVRPKATGSPMVPAPPVQQYQAREDWQRWREGRIGRFAGYLRTMGRPNDADWVEREAKAGNEARDIIRAGSGQMYAFASLRSYALTFGIGAIALRSAATLLLLGALAWLASRTRRIREGRPIENRVAPQLVSAVIVPLALAAILWVPGAVQGAWLVRATSGWMGGEGGDPRGFILGLAIVNSAIPMLILTGLAIWSLVKRIPVSVGVVRGMKALAVPVASALILLGAAMSVPTLRADRQLRDTLARITQHEGREYARNLGRQWPD